MSMMLRRRMMLMALGKSATPVYQMAQLDASGWTVRRCTISFSGTVTTVTVTSSSTSALKQAYFLCDPTHKYAVTGIFKKESTTNACVIGMYKPGANGYVDRLVYPLDTTEDVQIGGLLTPDSTYYGLTINHATSVVAPAITIIDKLQVYDMTLLFGSGNEPTTFAGFETACASAGIDLTAYHPYVAV